ncbi:MAG TPA: hypothetical protein VML55_20845, partial [Planctomycetaceae bacterium]|nr:hypothetical protein [Planctomycetaceae bacterium]
MRCSDAALRAAGGKVRLDPNKSESLPLRPPRHTAEGRSAEEVEYELYQMHFPSRQPDQNSGWFASDSIVRATLATPFA